MIADDARIGEALRQLVAAYKGEAGEADEPWDLDRLRADYLERMAQGIVTFEIPILRPEGEFKLSQNRSVGDRERVIEALARRARRREGVRALMQATMFRGP